LMVVTPSVTFARILMLAMTLPLVNLLAQYVVSEWH